MKRLVFALLATVIAGTSAQADIVRYDFSGSVTPQASDGASGAQFAADLGAGAFTGFVAFDTAGPDFDPDPNLELYSASDFALDFGTYSFSAANADVAQASLDLNASELLFTFLSVNDFAPGVAGEFFSFNFGFLIPGLGSGIAQSPAPPASLVDFALLGGDGGFLLGDGQVAQIAATTAPIPEPATWAMMIGGFALIGGALRYRRTGTPALR